MPEDKMSYSDLLHMNRLIKDLSVEARKNWLEQLEAPENKRIYFRELWVNDNELMEGLKAALR